MNERYVHPSEFHEKLDQFRSELQAQIEAVRGEIRPSIRSELDHEIERLKLTIGTAWKVLGVAIAVVVGAAAYFSIKTEYDVDKGIEAAANREVAHKLADDNVKSPFKRVLTKALVDSYLVRLARFESDQKKSPFQFPQSVDLDAVAADQLTTSLKDPTTTEEDFKKVVEVLVRTRPYDNPTTSSRSTSSPVSRQLGNLVKGASPDFGWVLNEPSRRSFVLKRLVRSYDVDLISASKIILKDESDTGLLVAAAQYLEANGDRDSAQVLENAFKRRTDDPDVSKACLIAVARLQPRSPVVQKHLDDLVAGRSEKLKLLEAPTLAAEFLKDTPLFERPEDARDLVFEHCLRESGALAMAGGGARPTPAARIHLHAAVIMPDHVHLLLTPLRGQNGWPFPLVGILQCLKGVTAHRINKLLHISGPVWEEESFDHVLRSEESLKEKAQYIQQNPVEAGLVRAPEDYRWLWISPDLKL